MAQDAHQFFNSIPFVTWYLLIFIFSLTTVSTFGITTPLHYYFDAHLVFREMQLWRLLTSIFFLGPFGFNFIISILMFLQYSKQTEEDVCNGEAADYLWCVAFGACMLFGVGGLLMKLPFLASSLLMYLVYVKCNSSPDVNLTLMFIPIQVKAVYFPWALMILHVAMGQSPFVDVVGILAGHAYYYLRFMYPKIFGKHIFWTPSLLYRVFPKQGAGSVSGFGADSSSGSEARVRNPFRSNHWWGSGRKLKE